MLHILVVCTANICRSPAGQVFLQHDLQGKDVRVDSAGIMASVGYQADPIVRSMVAARGYGEGLENHRSRLLLSSYIPEYDLILCMERFHLDYLRNMSPATVGKSMLYGHWADNREVADPTGESESDYSRALDEIGKYSTLWADKLVEMGMAR